MKERYGGKKQSELNGGPSVITNRVTVEELERLISEQGDKVRQLKAQKSDKQAIDENVAILLNLKKQHATLKGGDAVKEKPGKAKKKHK